MKYKQCLLARGTERTVGWIPLRGAKKGLMVELKEYPGDFWEVLEAYSFIADDEDVKKMQNRARKSFASIK